LIAYVTVGYPSIEATLKVVPRLAKSGADIVELGIPFSDPLADGITIQQASFHALQNGVTPATCLEIARQLRAKTDVPLVFMTYYNPVFSYGLKEFVAECARSGIDGLIIPDLPPEEGAELQDITQSSGLDLIYLLAPNSSAERIRLVAERSRGFIYLVSVTGVTGARKDLPANLASFVTRVRKMASQPLCVGFGISRPEQAKKIASLADGIIVGSRLIQLMAEDKSLTSAQRLVVELRRALDSPVA
jgi:tryptophan synthase alpha chain